MYIYIHFNNVFYIAIIIQPHYFIDVYNIDDDSDNTCVHVQKQLLIQWNQIEHIASHLGLYWAGPHRLGLQGVWRIRAAEFQGRPKI